METVHYEVEQSQRPAFLATMAEVRRVRGRAGAHAWQLYEDVAHPEGWLEVWSVESWTDHLREVTRLPKTIGPSWPARGCSSAAARGRDRRATSPWIRCTCPRVRLPANRRV